MPVVDAVSREVEALAGSSGPLGKGGMASKLQAARKASEAGIACVIADGLHAGVLPRIFDAAQTEGTLFLPTGDRLTRRKHWIAHTLKPAGSDHRRPGRLRRDHARRPQPAAEGHHRRERHLRRRRMRRLPRPRAAPSSRAGW